MYLKNNKAQNVVCVLSLCQGEIYVEATIRRQRRVTFFVHISLGNIGCVLEGMIMLGRVDHNIRKVVSKTVARFCDCGKNARAKKGFAVTNSLNPWLHADDGL